MLTENVAILIWIADRAPALAPTGILGRYRLIEMLSFIATEIHKRFPIYLSVPDAAKPMVREDIEHWFEHVARHVALFGSSFSVADAYLFVMARGGAGLGFTLPATLHQFVARIEARTICARGLRREKV